MPYLDIDGFRLYYEVQGSGPALVFLHGAGGNHLSWWQQIPYFRERYTCINLDQRAFGLSVDVAGGPGRRAFATDLKALLDHLDARDVALVAHSMGGRTAAGFILRVQDPAERNVWALILSGTHGGVVTPESREIQARLRKSSNGRSLRERALSASFVRSHPDLAYLYAQIGRLNPPRPSDFLAPIPGYLGTTRDAYAERNLPVLFITGTEDEVMSPEAIRIAADVLPGAHLTEIEGAGHSTYYERPDVFNGAVSSFLARHTPSGAP
jgi:3-oxoadipate enol-lactonase